MNQTSQLRFTVAGILAGFQIAGPEVAAPLALLVVAPFVVCAAAPKELPHEVEWFLVAGLGEELLEGPGPS